MLSTLHNLLRSLFPFNSEVCLITISGADEDYKYEESSEGDSKKLSSNSRPSGDFQHVPNTELKNSLEQFSESSSGEPQANRMIQNSSPSILSDPQCDLAKLENNSQTSRDEEHHKVQNKEF